jgi:hypothetical protein
MVAHGEGWGKRIRIIRIIISTNNNQLSLKALFQLFIFVSNSFAVGESMWSLVLFCFDSTKEMQAFLCIRYSKIWFFAHFFVPL